MSCGHHTSSAVHQSTSSASNRAGVRRQIYPYGRRTPNGPLNVPFGPERFPCRVSALALRHSQPVPVPRSSFATRIRFASARASLIADSHSANAAAFEVRWYTRSFSLATISSASTVEMADWSSSSLMSALYRAAAAGRYRISTVLYRMKGLQ